MSNMDLTVMVQRIELVGVPPKPMRVTWWIYDNVVVCFKINVGVRVSNTCSKTQLEPSVQEESIQMVDHRPKRNL